MTGRKLASELLATPGAVLDRQHLAELGWQRRSIDWFFRELAVVSPPGVRRVYIKVEDYLRAVDEHTYTKNQVRPS